MIVVFGDREHALVGHIAPAEDVLQKRNDVFVFFGTAEGNDEQGVVAGHNFIVGDGISWDYASRPSGGSAPRKAHLEPRTADERRRVLRFLHGQRERAVRAYRARGDHHRATRGGESDYRSIDVCVQLAVWAKRDGRGKVFGPSEFIVPSGAAYSPDAAWVSNERLTQLTKAQRRKFLRLCPEFVVEVMSPSDRLKPAREKMDDWMANGVQLSWLIDGDNQTVYIYRAGQGDAEKRVGIAKLAGEGPLAGFELDLTDIWAGL
jgi:Uma2 family endonuclease